MESTNVQGRRKRSVKEKQKEEKSKNMRWKLTLIEWTYITVMVNIFNNSLCDGHNFYTFKPLGYLIKITP